jgi:adenylate kinase
MSPRSPRTILVTGTTGAGKTTAARTLARLTGWGLVSASSMILDVAREQRGVSHRDDIKRLNEQEQASIHASARERIRQALAEHPVSLLDDHLVVLASGGAQLIEPPPDYVAFYGVEFIVVLQVRPEVVLERTRTDRTDRHRPIRTADEIWRELNHIIEVARRLPGDHEVRVFGFDDRDSDNAVEEFAATLRAHIERSTP